jgi:hypothetical protein
LPPPALQCFDSSRLRPWLSSSWCIFNRMLAATWLIGLGARSLTFDCECLRRRWHSAASRREGTAILHSAKPRRENAQRNQTDWQGGLSNKSQCSAQIRFADWLEYYEILARKLQRQTSEKHNRNLLIPDEGPTEYRPIRSRKCYQLARK